MFKKMNFAFLCILVALAMTPVSSVAEEQESGQADTKKSEPTETPASSGSWISNGKALGKWWAGRARAQDPMPPELLYHLDASYSFTKLGGDDDETQHKVKGNIILRKNIMTNWMTYKLKDKETNYGTYTKLKEKQSFDESIFFEFWEKLALGAIFQWSTYNRDYYEDRYIFTAGGYATFIESPKLVLKAGLYYGYNKIVYMNDDLEAKYGETLPDFTSDIVSANQKFSWTMTDRIAFTESANYGVCLKDTDLYYWVLTLALDFELTKNISLVGSYELDHSVNEVDLKFGEGEEESSEFDLSIKIKF
ncbi:MAG: DUF481 domain-containing protein [Desulfobacteraceae bacterium]|nr:DUF481 domain-containing protein [Desulfobacteraceae bacterium]